MSKYMPSFYDSYFMTYMYGVHPNINDTFISKDSIKSLLLNYSAKRCLQNFLSPWDLPYVVKTTHLMA